jgi:glutamyl/glutaminyl-tRNA synthetase
MPASWWKAAMHIIASAPPNGWTRSGRTNKAVKKIPLRWIVPEIGSDEADVRVARGERYVVRFKIPQTGSVTATDLIRGDITVENSAMDDHIIVRSDGLALYHLAAMVDDHLMDISHVIRGSEWLSTFPLHVQIIRAFGWQEPQWVHLSVFLKPSGKGKMSKRGATLAQSDRPYSSKTWKAGLYA